MPIFQPQYLLRGKPHRNPLTTSSPMFPSHSHPEERVLPRPFPPLTNLSSNPKGLNPHSFKHRKKRPQRFFPNGFKNSHRVSPGRFKIIEGPSRRVIKR